MTINNWPKLNCEFKKGTGDDGELRYGVKLRNEIKYEMNHIWTRNSII